jgi:hypothetical protein
MNPFRFEGPLDGPELIGREAELKSMVGFALDRRVVSVAGPRRYGKTSLLRAAGSVLEAEHGFVVAHIDLQALSGLDDFVARFGSGWRQATRAHRRARRAFETVAGGLSSLGLTLLGTGVQFSRRERDPQSALTIAHALLELPAEAEAPVLIVLDEFQDLHGAWPEGEGVLRSHTQAPAQAGKVAYAFAGSEPSLLAAAFEDHGRAYYQQVLRLPIGRLRSADLSRTIAERFTATRKEAGSALGPLLDLADGHPQRAMLLAHLLWEQTRADGRADERWPAALKIARAQANDEAAAIWESLSRVQRAALRAVAEQGSATASGTTGLRSSRQRAAQALQARGLVEPIDQPGPRGGARLRLVDPLLADWLAQRTGT